MTDEQKKIKWTEQELFAPALQEAARKAKAEGYVLEDVVYGAANAYLNMMVALMDKKRALALLENQVSFLKSKINE